MGPEGLSSVVVGHRRLQSRYPRDAQRKVALPVARMLGLEKRYPWVAWNHGYTRTSMLDRMYTQLDRWSLRKAYRVVTVCRPFADRIVELGVPRDRITILHNAVKPFVGPPSAEVERVRRELGIGGEAVILSVGRLSLEKGHADLLRARRRCLTRMERLCRPFALSLLETDPSGDARAACPTELGVEKSRDLCRLPARYPAILRNDERGSRSIPQ